MDLVHLHLLLNHFPSIGFLTGVGLFLAGLAGKSNELRRAALVVFLGIALISLPAYMSGNGAAETICVSQPGTPCQDSAVSKALIEAHESAALLGMALMQLTGAFAWLGLWQFRRAGRFPRWNLVLLLVLSVVTFGLMTRASNMGGDIRHAEIRTAQPAAVAEGQPLARAVGLFVTGVPWGWPACETLHFIGLCLLFGVAALVDLRMLGMMKSVPFSALHRLMPWAILGFGVNLVTGMLFFIADPGQYTQNGAFQWKMALVLVAGINVVYFTAFDQPWAVQSGDDAPLTAKIAAATAMALVVGVIFCGRMLPFLGNSF